MGFNIWRGNDANTQGEQLNMALIPSTTPGSGTGGGYELPTVIYSLTGRLNEQIARLPFALANLTALLALFLLGWRLIGALAGWTAAMLLALDGYLIAFARIVQYQSIVFLMSVLVVLLLHRLVQNEGQEGQLLRMGDDVALSPPRPRPLAHSPFRRQGQALPPTGVALPCHGTPFTLRSNLCPDSGTLLTNFTTSQSTPHQKGPFFSFSPNPCSTPRSLHRQYCTRYLLSTLYSAPKLQ